MAVFTIGGGPPSVPPPGGSPSTGGTVVGILRPDRDYQREAIDKVFGDWGLGQKSLLLVLPCGCHRAGERVLRFDGTTVAVEDVVVGDQLMGPDSFPRTVLALCRGTGRMMRVTPSNGRVHFVNDEHVLSLRMRSATVDMTVSSYLECSHEFKRDSRLWRSAYRPSGVHKLASFAVCTESTSEPYYGFTLDADQRYLTDDYTVFHNSGKTIVSADIIRRTVQQTSQKTIFMAHRAELLTQSRDKIRLVAPQLSVGIVQAKHDDLSRQVTVASVQTLMNATRLQRVLQHGPYSLLVIDECFPAGTMVGGTAIEDLRVGALVPSFDETTGRACQGRVARVFRSTPRGMVRVHFRGMPPVACTPGHPFFTSRGWVAAGLLTSDDAVLGVTSGLTKAAKNQVRSMQCIDHEAAGHGHSAVLRPVHRGKEQRATASEVMGRIVREMSSAAQSSRDEGEQSQERGSGVLLAGVLRRGSARVQLAHNGEHKPQARQRTHDGTQPDGQPGNESANEVHLARDGMEADGARRQWDRTDETAGTPGVATQLADGGCGPHREGEGVRLPDLLQDRRCGTDAADRDRGRWRLAPWGESCDRHEKDGALEWTWVDRVEILEQSGDGTFGGVCPDGFVYNLEVAGTHTYVAGGHVVHNCHHAASPSWMKVIRALQTSNPTMRTLGLTATPGRSDGLGLSDLFEKISYTKSTLELIEEKWLVYPRAFRVNLNIDLDVVGSTKGTDGDKDFKDGDLAKLLIQQPVLDATLAAYKQYGDNRTMIGFSVTVEHARLLAETFTKAGIISSFVSGDTKHDDRQKLYADFRAGTLRVLFSCSVLVEGFDEPSAGGVLLARPTMSQSLFIQMVGRGLRPYPTKSDCIIIDCAGNTKKHAIVQMSTLAGFEQFDAMKSEKDTIPREGGEDREVIANGTDMYGNEVRITDIRGSTRESTYSWRQTDYGYALMIPKVGYYLVSNDKGDLTTAHIRFYDTRKTVDGRPAPPRSITDKPIDCNLAYGLVESEAKRMLRAAMRAANEKRPTTSQHPDKQLSFDAHLTKIVDNLEPLLVDGIDDESIDDHILLARTARWRDGPRTEAQTKLLTKLGTKVDNQPATAGEASDLISIATVEKHQRTIKMHGDPATPKQRWFLRVNGIPHEPDVNKAEAAKLIFKFRMKQKSSSH